ncbi:MAG: hypothetical protein A2046_09420 [Bacteroidetes bacterium GWA2_30_7]|nr:MAG: hypothetical protein A2046_09420 [Bacteroidetes bacterium GWA2_30_7]
MKILQICNKMPYPPNDGGAIATLNVSKSFCELGHEVTILSLNTKKHYSELSKIPEELKKIIRFIPVDIDTTIKSNLALKNLLFSSLPYNAQRFICENFKNKLITLLCSEKFDIIQIEGLYMGLYIETIKKYSTAKIALRAHNIEHEIWKRTYLLEKNILKRQYLIILTNRIKRLKKRLLNSYDLLVPITNRDEQFFKEFGNTKPSHVTPIGININESKEDFSNIEYPSVFHLGALDWAPNQEGIIWFLKNIWKGLKEKNPELNFYIAGRNAPDWFVNKIKCDGVVYHGEIDNAYEFINSKAVMVVPLLSGSGMRVKIIEGLALGKTIVSTSIGAEGIDITHNQNIIIADSTKSFKDSLNTVLTNKIVFENIGKNAVKFAHEYYDNLNIAKSLIDFYSKNM